MLPLDRTLCACLGQIALSFLSSIAKCLPVLTLVLVHNDIGSKMYASVAWRVNHGRLMRNPVAMACCQCMSTLYRAFASVWSEDVEGEQKPSNLPSTGHSTNPGRLRAHFPIIQLSMLPFENRGHGLSCLFKAENRHPQMDEPKHISSFLYLKYLGFSAFCF
ncbi:hypothetical protein TESG_01990 [Trichophyton tonsurans CBS 112818]|uniref:Uncharacterized protein n=1 Tax=Trichophyton tonsurans (strain CBS 112818) TaxID=647933 RepID=F2RT25_TRIT1|nr:hypothetical protein TESG_01990 [Trichophyton tonsurans CBS 112818]